MCSVKTSVFCQANWSGSIRWCTLLCLWSRCPSVHFSLKSWKEGLATHTSWDAAAVAPNPWGRRDLPWEGVIPHSALLLGPCYHEANVPWGTHTGCKSISLPLLQARKHVVEKVWCWCVGAPVHQTTSVPHQLFQAGFQQWPARGRVSLTPLPAMPGQNFLTFCLQSPGQFLPARAPGFIIAIFQQIHEIHFSSNHSSVATLIMMF